MMSPALVGGVAAVAAVLTAAAEDFPLKFETIPAKDVLAFPGGSGTYGRLLLVKPAKIKTEPRAVSQRPLYGECRELPSGPAFAFRLDESKGTGQGYDRLIVDMNQNGDLTDDPVAQPVALPGQRRVSSPSREEALFGPVAAPADKRIAGGRPAYYAHLYLYNRQALESAPADRNLFIGQLQFKAGWYLDTTVELGGVKRKVGVFDGDSNLRLGDAWQPQIYRPPSGGGETWYFQIADSFLVDADGSGKFETDPLESKFCPFGPILYFGPTPYQVGLAADNTALRIEPWKDELAEVTLQPQGGQVHSLTLAWERPNGKWQLIQPGVAEGKIKVPSGNYRLYQCTLLGSGAAARDHVKLSAYERTLKKPFSFAAGKANILACGAPLEVKVSANKRRTTGASSSKESDFVLSISTRVVGGEGEVYSTFLKGEKLDARPPRPTFSVLDAGGKRLTSGNLEYG
jgi:hypothetical protein